MNSTISISEEHGLQALRQEDLRVYSVGISTAGVAEIRFAEANPDRSIVATTIDEKGLVSAQQRITASSVASQIISKLEDVAKPLPYNNESFDFIYARLVLHYLPRTDLQKALAELYRILKFGGKLFIVVRSNTCPDAIRNTSSLNAETGMTTFISKPNKDASEKIMSRYFHSENSIREFVQAAGFCVESIVTYNEKLFDDFNRSITVDHWDNLVELIASK